MKVRYAERKSDLLTWEIPELKVIDESHCKKRKVVAVISDDSGEWLGLGWNGPPEEVEAACPRMGMESGEHYELCDVTCPGQRHAEVDALEDVEQMYEFVELSGPLVMYVYGHDHICEHCLAACEKAGIEEIVIIDKDDYDGL